MGDNLDGDTNALPLHNVMLNAFFMDRFEVTKELYQSVQTWSAANGYTIGAGAFKAPSHPVQSVNWYDAVTWCNARSEKEGLTPCYYTDDAQTAVLRRGAPITNAQVKWTANGYRLPTEAEWEKAARGGSLGQRFPWGNTITQTLANYNAQPTFYPYDLNSTSGVHPTYSINNAPYTSPVGVFAPNGYGLYDMAGNVWEWCWDWYDSSYYGHAAASSNPRGPNSGAAKVFRGGMWVDGAQGARSAARSYGELGRSDYYWGFRCVRGL